MSQIITCPSRCPGNCTNSFLPRGSRLSSYALITEQNLMSCNSGALSNRVTSGLPGLPRRHTRAIRSSPSDSPALGCFMISRSLETSTKRNKARRLEVISVMQSCSSSRTLWTTTGTRIPGLISSYSYHPAAFASISFIAITEGFMDSATSRRYTPRTSFIWAVSTRTVTCIPGFTSAKGAWTISSFTCVACRIPMTPPPTAISARVCPTSFTAAVNTVPGFTFSAPMT
mmetsp:Transcript_13052/g.31509  ORF Transcript_13052/g.31509 Transcript_13052/m.31509 type:complete len:229 (+) Transcript_13052:2001-2687(+)